MKSSKNFIFQEINRFLLNLCKWKNTGFTFKLQGQIIFFDTQYYAYSAVD